MSTDELSEQVSPSDSAPFDLSEASDGILAGRSSDGDERAFEILVRRHGPLMRAYVIRILGSNSDADDVVQEAFITAWRELATTEVTAVKAWLMKIASRKAIDRVRSRRRVEPLEDWDAETSDSESPHRLAEVASQREVLSRALSRLPVVQRQCWVLREVGDRSYDEIAEELGIPPSTVRGSLARARKTLAKEMEEWR
ncbi:RNA polymerase sigma factor [Marisediminicola sp. LYQ134]|uniref:RNA polymerase sigma factor n=1 Tax=unclassified Marisediminicola TaxID=2618316 RepID=UPI0039838FFF